MKDNRQQIENRQFNNKMILDEIGLFIQKHPDMRFHQILQSMRINTTKLVSINSDSNGAPNDIIIYNDLFNEEPEITLGRIYIHKHEWDNTPEAPEKKGKYPQAKMDF
jgi:hypothetical protein